ncbi:hypothetical protein [Fodinicola feengrottensis]|uniref:hypothetical protein n=1 Tax=Fodinicola feengrottensis TaxID=435914 RepID=UPI002441B8A6|nr:hypothetical protein [Fodinicola feengrottensis]
MKTLLRRVVRTVPLGAPAASKAALRTKPLANRLLVNPVLVAAIALVVIAVAAAGWCGWSYQQAAHDESLRYSQLRDEVRQAGEQAVQNLNTLDYRNAAAGLAVWAQSTTGDLHQQLTDNRPQVTAQLQKAQTVTTARVLEAALTTLDDRAGTATVIVALKITVTRRPARRSTRATASRDS